MKRDNRLSYKVGFVSFFYWLFVYIYPTERLISPDGIPLNGIGLIIDKFNDVFVSLFCHDGCIPLFGGHLCIERETKNRYGRHFVWRMGYVNECDGLVGFHAWPSFAIISNLRRILRFNFH